MDSPQEANRRRKTSPSYQPLYIISAVIFISATCIAIVYLFMANGYFSMAQKERNVLRNKQNGAVEEALKQEILRIKEAGNSASTIPVAPNADEYQPDLNKQFPNCFMPPQEGMQHRNDISQFAVDCPMYYEVSSPMSERIFASNASVTQMPEPMYLLLTYSTQKQGELPNYLNYMLYPEKPEQEVRSQLLTGMALPGEDVSGPLLSKAVITEQPVRVLIDEKIATGVVVQHYDCRGDYDTCETSFKSILVQVDGGLWFGFYPPEKDKQKLEQPDITTIPVFEFMPLAGAEL